MLSSLLLFASLFAVPCFSSHPVNTNKPTLVNIRIEGATHTIFEGTVLTKGHNVRTKSGGDHECNGLNNNANPTPGPTCTSALDDASENHRRFPFDGTFDPSFDDFFITSIGGSTQTATEFWGLLLDSQFTPVGGCQQEVKHGQDILWAFNAFNAEFFLKATGPERAHRNRPVVYTVIDGMTGNPVEGATIGGATTDANGHATVVFHSDGLHSLKAEHANSIRSNAVETVVT